MSEKIISIIVPCYNVEKYIERCLNSILNQTIGIENMEIILVDDCSTDGTREILRGCQEKYPFLTVLFNEENLRQGGARNRGIEIATGKYLGFVDSDDWIEPDMYLDMCQTADRYDCDLLNIWSVRSSKEGFLSPDEIPTGKRDQRIRLQNDKDRSDIIASGYIKIGAWNCIFRRDMICEHQIRFPEHLAYEDILWGTAVLLYVQNVYIMEKRYYHYFVNPVSTVLAPNENWHQDYFTVQRLRWEEIKRRGGFERYREAEEFDYLLSYFIPGLKILSLRYTTFPYQQFYELQADIRERIPNWRQNQYLKTNATDFQKMQLELIDLEVSHAELDEVAKITRKYYGASG